MHVMLIVDRAKAHWKAWHDVKGFSKEAAMMKYIQTIKELSKEAGQPFLTPAEKRAEATPAIEASEVDKPPIPEETKDGAMEKVDDGILEKSEEKEGVTVGEQKNVTDSEATEEASESAAKPAAEVTPEAIPEMPSAVAPRNGDVPEEVTAEGDNVGRADSALTRGSLELSATEQKERGDVSAEIAQREESEQLERGTSVVSAVKALESACKWVDGLTGEELSNAKAQLAPKLIELGARFDLHLAEHSEERRPRHTPEEFLKLESVQDSVQQFGLSLLKSFLEMK